MDKRKIIKEKLYPIFCEINKQQRRYGEVWLSFADFGKIYFTDDLYELKVKMLPGVKRNSKEIEEIIKILDQKAKEEFKPIWVVEIIGADEFKHCKKKDVMVYCEGS
jgi:hypothetical protein